MVLIENLDTRIEEAGPGKFRPDYRIIYTPGDAAREYSELACNPYNSCGHACRYCWVKNRKSDAEKALFDKGGDPKKDFLRKVQYKAERMKGDPREICLSFLGDVYQPLEMDLRLTRGALKILRENDLCFTTLTKGGTRAVRDFDILQDYSKARFGSTIVFMSQESADYWEPGAPTIRDRIQAITRARAQGISTWVSLEPVISPEEALQVIKDLHPIVDHWKMGRLRYHKAAKNVDWVSFREQAKDLLESLGANYYLKRSLTEL